MSIQLALFPDPPPPDETPVYRADPATVRAELQGVLATLRAAKTMPWDARRVAFWQTVFPQMSRGLPDGEAAAMREAFSRHMDRLSGAG